MTLEPWLTTTRRVVGPEAAGDLGRVDAAVAADRDEVHCAAVVARHVVERPDHRVVLDRGGDGVVARPQQALDHHVEGVGGVVGEHQAVGVVAAEEARQLQPRVLDDVAGDQAEVVAGAARVDPDLGVLVGHRLDHRLGLRVGRRRVVQIGERAEIWQIAVVAHERLTRGNGSRRAGRRQGYGGGRARGVATRSPRERHTTSAAAFPRCPSPARWGGQADQTAGARPPRRLSDGKLNSGHRFQSCRSEPCFHHRTRRPARSRRGGFNRSLE